MVSILHGRKRTSSGKKKGTTKHKKAGVHGYRTPLPKGAKRDPWQHKDMMR